MQLTKEVADRYIGGQVEIQNSEERYIYRGEVTTITVEDDVLKITFNWMAQGVGFPPIPSRWVNSDQLTYDAALCVYTVSDIGDGRLCVQSHIIGETTILYPPGGSRLDPAKVEGLEASTAS